MSSVAVVIPVRDHATLLVGCLDALAPVIDAGVEVVVVDDASTDATAEVARQRGASVIVNDEPGGPYVARNIGWRATEADVLAFTDVRCRARGGWLHALVSALETHADAAVVGGDTHTLPGPTAAERFAHRRQALLAAPALAHDFLPYLPTCNIATPRHVLEAVGGFTEVASGGDVDYSWRVQLAGAGSVAHAAGADMDWVPRTTTTAIVGQYRKYGDAWPRTAARFLADGFVPQRPRDVPSWRLAAAHLRILARTIAGNVGHDAIVDVVEQRCWHAYWDAYHRSWEAQRAAGVPLPPRRPPGAA